MSEGRRDIVAASLLLVFSAILYLPLGIALSNGAYYDDINLAFDFDPDRYVKVFTAPPARWSAETFPADVAIKHPFIGLVGEGCRLLPGCQEYPKRAAVLIAIGHGIATNILFFLCLRAMRLARPEALVASAIFAASAGQLFNALIVEAYVVAGTGIAAYLLVSLLRQRAPNSRLVWIRVVLAVHLFGVTATNIVQAVLAELVLLGEQKRRAQHVTDLLRVALIALAIIVGLVILIWPGVLPALFADPAQALRSVLWTAPHEGAKSPISVLKSFFVFVLAAPEFTAVTIDGDKTMLDFRALRFSPPGFVLLCVWLAALVYGTVTLLRAERRRCAALLLVLVAFNVLLHIFFQYRGSTFLYVAHVNAAVVLLAAGTLYPVAEMAWRYRAPALAIAGAFLFLEIETNVGIAQQLIDAFR